MRSVTEQRDRAAARYCVACRRPLDPVLITIGWDKHPNCYDEEDQSWDDENWG